MNDAANHSWRHKAVQYRMKAEGSLSQSVRKIFLDLAMHCDSLADREEQLRGRKEKDSAYG